MELKSSFSKLTLPRVLRVLDQGYATGVLSANIPSDQVVGLNGTVHLIWLEEGHIVATQQENDHRDIYGLAVSKGWMTPLVAETLKTKAPKNLPAGTYLESQQFVSFDQLRSLFMNEVVSHAQSLCNMKDIVVSFQKTTELPKDEMTGFRIPAAKIAK
jgi:hypothetical protein